MWSSEIEMKLLKTSQLGNTWQPAAAPSVRVTVCNVCLNILERQLMSQGCTFISELFTPEL